MHLSTFGNFAQHILLPASVCHAVNFLYSHHIRGCIVYNIRYTLEITYIIHTVCILDIVAHQFQRILSLCRKSK